MIILLLVFIIPSLIGIFMAIKEQRDNSIVIKRYAERLKQKELSKKGKADINKYIFVEDGEEAEVYEEEREENELTEESFDFVDDFM